MDEQPRRQRVLRRLRVGTVLWIAVFSIVALGYRAFPGLAADDGSPETALVTEASTGSGSPGEGVSPGEAEHESGRHSDPVAPVLAGIVLILLLAKLSGDIFERFGMPAVLGELVVGVLIGNAVLLTSWAEGVQGVDFLHEIARKLEFIKPYEQDDDAEVADGVLMVSDADDSEVAHGVSVGETLKVLASIGVVLLLFEVGLETSVRDMVSVGASSVLVALLGVIAPLVLGYFVGLFFVPDAGWQVHAFHGATLCATSVGITARVLKDLGRSQEREAKIILGAAVIDDVLGLIVLAVVSGLITSGSIDVGNVAAIVAKSLGFLTAAILLGTRLFTRPLFKFASYLRGHGLLVATALVICFGFAWLANLVGLHPIVGAFAAGLILERAHYRELGQKEHVELEEALAPLTALLVPIFVIEMGVDVDLESFRDPSVWGLAAALTAAAVVGKQACSFGVLEEGKNRLAVGLGMIPRGEVGLIFAKLGKDLTYEGRPVFGPQTYSAIVVMVMVTTMVTPPLLKWSLQRGARSETGGAPAD